MIKKTALLLILFAFSFAKPIGINDNIGNFSLINQFDKIQSVNNDDSTLIIAFDKDSGTKVNEFLSSKDKNFLQNHNTYYIANISGMPSIITKLFALPKMRKYNFPILLLYDNKSHDFINKEGLISVYKIKNGIVKNITFIEAKEVTSIF